MNIHIKPSFKNLDSSFKFIENEQLLSIKMELVKNKKDIPFLIVLERINSKYLNGATIRKCIKKSDNIVLRYLKDNGIVALYRKLLDVYNYYYNNGIITSKHIKNLIIVYKDTSHLIPNPLVRFIRN